MPAPVPAPHFSLLEWLAKVSDLQGGYGRGPVGLWECQVTGERSAA